MSYYCQHELRGGNTCTRPRIAARRRAPEAPHSASGDGMAEASPSSLDRHSSHLGRYRGSNVIRSSGKRSMNCSGRALAAYPAHPPEQARIIRKHTSRSATLSLPFSGFPTSPSGQIFSSGRNARYSASTAVNDQRWRRRRSAERTLGRIRPLLSWIRTAERTPPSAGPDGQEERGTYLGGSACLEREESVSWM